MTRVGVDVGGTFTDLVALERDGSLQVTKVPSTPSDPARGLWASVDATPGLQPGAVLHGTTVATNALLERRGARVVLLATRKFEDLLWLRRQDRAGLYDLALQHTAPLVAPGDVVGVEERIGADGIVTPLTDEEIQRVANEVRALAPGAVAISLLFSFRDPSHEQRMAQALRDALPGVPVVPSCEILPVFREYERTSTTVAEAFLRPTVGGYVERLGTEAARREIPEVRVMASSGGTLGPRLAQQRATALALSGPAAGVEGARLVARALGDRNLLTLDMGGTSADASVVVEGEALTRTGGSVGGTALALPHVLIETVGAGGGSVAWVDVGGALRVGPHSAGADPGPACYGRGGAEATVTDAVLALGWLDPGKPLAADVHLDEEAARDAVERVAQAAGLAAARCAEGIVDIAVATMVRALRRVSVERGLDPRQMTLVPFGGAGPLFGCRMAASLRMARVVVPPHPGVLSALGLAAAASRVEALASAHRLAGDVASDEWEGRFAELEREVLGGLPAADLVRFADCRYPGQGYELSVPATAGSLVVAEAFHGIHAARYGHADAQRPVEIVNLRVVGTRPGMTVRLGGRNGEPSTPRNGDMVPGETFDGPATIALEDATIRIERGWRGLVHETGALIVQRRDDPSSAHAAGSPC